MTSLSRLTVDELVKRYAELSLLQKAAADLLEMSKVNRLGERIDRVSNELQNRPGDQRAALIPLLDHPNLDVRFNAAADTINVAPLQARATMKQISESGRYPVAGRAGMYLLTIHGKYSGLLRK